MFAGAAAMLLAGLLGSQSARADGYDNDEDYGYYDEGSSYDNQGSTYDDQGSSYDDDAEIYYENYYGADNAYDLYFHRTLGGYGEWINLPGVGFVWRPWTRSGWAPYSLGYWGYASTSWSWVSYEPFGHITYNYGNWGYLDDYGWCWFPGYRWAPHHVQWSSYDGYVGWCPTPPRLYGHSYRFHNYDRNYLWVQQRNFLDRNVNRYARRQVDLWRNGRGPRNIPVLSSPSRTMAERWTGRAVDHIRLEQVNRSTRRGNVQIWVPDRQTRQQVEREGRVSVRPWLDLKRRQESPNSDERRRGVQAGSNRNRDRDASTGEPQRTTPRVRRDRDQGQTQTQEQGNQQREERRSTPWRRYRRSNEDEAGSSTDRNQSEGRSRSEERGRSEERRQTEERRRGRQESREEAREESKDDSSKDSDQPSRGSKVKKDDDDESKKESKSSEEHRSRDRGRNNDSKEHRNSGRRGRP
jgi:hypothetical protein